jgi:hypothetical protein
VGDDQQQVDVAAAWDVVVQGQGAVQDRPGEGLPERPGAGVRASSLANRSAASADVAAGAAQSVERLGGTHARCAILALRERLLAPSLQRR